MTGVSEITPRRDKWARFAPYDQHLHLVIPEIGDDMDDSDRAIDRLAKEVAKVKGLMFGVLISTSTGVILLAANLIAEIGP